MISSTPLRKSINKKATDDIDYTPLQEYNDDHERASRRSVYCVEHSLSSVPEFSSTETLEQVTQHMKICEKLFSENKINIRNAWEINIIDYMHQYVYKNKVVSSEVMLEGARMLEVCVKVFSCKVDYLSQEMVKLVSSKDRAIEEDKENAVIDEDNANNTVDKGTKRRKKKIRARPTITKEKNSIFLKEIPKMVPNNFVENIDINANNYQNMSTNKIPMDHARCKFNLLNNEDCGFISYDNKDPTLIEKPFPNMFPVKPITICPEFKNFNVDEDDQTFNDSMINIVNDLEKSKSSGLVNNDVVYDDDGIPIPDLDGSTHDIFADQEDPIDFETVNRRIEMITSFCPLDIPTERNALDRSTANNSNIFLETVWVGPSHWKNKRILQSRSRYSGNPDQRVPRKKKRLTKRVQPTEIDLDASPVINFEKLCRGKAKHDIKKYTLPPNNLFSPAEFDLLMLQKLKPKSEYQSKEANESEFEHSPYDYDNPDDSQYCSQIDLADVADGGDDKETNVDGEEGHNDVEICTEKQNGPENDLPLCLDTEDALIEGPDLVTQVYVPYAHRSKNVNMRRLKSVMLECLTGKPVENNVPAEKLHVQPTAFSTILKQLPSKLPKGERNNVSVAMAFFSLLHLTNEHDLKLTGSKQLNDVKIE